MDRRDWINAACGTGIATGLLGLVAKHVGFPWLSEALGFLKVSGVEINWDGVWIIALIAAAAVAVSNNAKRFRRWLERRRYEKERRWDMNICDAISYVGHLSHFGRAWPDNTKQTAAAKAIYEAAKNGRLDVAGVPLGSMSLAKISAVKFDDKRWIDLKHCNQTEKNVFLLEEDRKTVAFSGLIADRRQIEKLWPPMPRSLY